MFPKEPMLTVRAPAIEAQLVETFALLTAQSPEPDRHEGQPHRPRSRGPRRDGVRLPPRAGRRTPPSSARAPPTSAAASARPAPSPTSSTACPRAARWPTPGCRCSTREYDAFKTYCELYPDNAILLVDTYNTLNSGIPNAIRAFDEVLRPKGITKCGIRLDSGDIAYLSRKAREMLDEAGWTDVRRSPFPTRSTSTSSAICWMQDAKIDSFGVGERLITARSEPVFGCVYKLVAVEDTDGNVVTPKIKISENVGKITNAAFQEALPLLRPRHGQGHRGLLCASTTRSVDDGDRYDHLRPRGDMEAQGGLSLRGARAARADLQKRRAGLQAAVARGDPRLLRASRSTRSGTRSSASTTRTATMWT